MPFDDPEESQDEIEEPEFRQQRSAYFPQFGNEQTPDQQNQGGNPEVVKGLMEMMKQYRTPPGPNGEYYKRVYPPMPEPEPEPTSGEKIMALRYPEGSPERERFWKPEKTLAEKLAEVIRQGRNLPPSSRLQIVKDPNAVGAGPPWPQEPQSIFRHFYPGMSEAELREASSTKQVPSTGHNDQTVSGAGTGANSPVVHVNAPNRQLSRIHHPAPVPTVQPNLRINDRRGQQRTLGGLMQSIRSSQPPRAVRHLTQDDMNEAAAVAYSENTNGTIRDYEAIITSILNRVRSGDRQFVDHGQEFTVRNVTHAHTRHSVPQFQGVREDPRDAHYREGRNYREFSQNHSQAAENARMAAENIAARGPTHNSRFFIAPPGGQRPTQRQVHNLGHNMQLMDQVDHVFLYGTAAHAPHGAARHGGPERPHLHTPERRR